MNKLTDDMQKALDSLNLNEIDKELLENILYQERVNKTKEWSTDAVRTIKELLSSIKLENIDE